MVAPLLLIALKLQMAILFTNDQLISSASCNTNHTWLMFDNRFKITSCWRKWDHYKVSNFFSPNFVMLSCFSTFVRDISGKEENSGGQLVLYFWIRYILQKWQFQLFVSSWALSTTSLSPRLVRVSHYWWRYSLYLLEDKMTLKQL